jgi:hypothetical protein
LHFESCIEELSEEYSEYNHTSKHGTYDDAAKLYTMKAGGCDSNENSFIQNNNMMGEAQETYGRESNVSSVLRESSKNSIINNTTS